jgi:RNA polymerase sigma-70 factor (ECF subfamily)
MFARDPGARSLSFAAAMPITSLAPPKNAARVVPSPTMADVYREHVAFVWRMVRRLGVADAQLEDAVQDVFVVVHRRLRDFVGRSSLRTWLAAIVRRVARDYRRTDARKPALTRGHAEQPVDDLCATHASPEENVMASEASRLLHQLLDQLDDDKREVFILAELERWSIAEIAEATGVKQNTASSRLRLAREAFEDAAARLRSRDEWRLR